jgi:hypothetical protein
MFLQLVASMIQLRKVAMIFFLVHFIQYICLYILCLFTKCDFLWRFVTRICCHSWWMSVVQWFLWKTDIKVWRMPSSGVWRRVDVVDWTDVSEDCIASIFWVEKSASDEPACSPAWARWFFARGFFYPEDGGDTILRNVGSIDYIYTAPHPSRRHSS